MDKVAPRLASKGDPKINSAEPVESHLEPSVNPIDVSAEIAIPTASASKVRCVPIPQPLLLKRRTSRSSMSSCHDPNDSAHHSPSNFGPLNVHLSPNARRPSTPNAAQLTFPSAASPSAAEPSSPAAPCRKSSFLSYLEYGSSPETEKSRLQPQSSPKYASPPVGSGGKYIVKTKRASWIDANAASLSQPNEASVSTPMTPVSLPDNMRMRHRKSSVVEVAAWPKQNQTQAHTPTQAQEADRWSQLPIPSLSSPSAHLMHKSGSLSRLRETKAPPLPKINPLRDSSLSSSSFKPDYALAEKGKSRWSHADDAATVVTVSTDVDESASATFTDNQTPLTMSPSLHGPGFKLPPTFHGRIPSISSVVTDTSVTTDEICSPSTPCLLQSQLLCSSISNKIAGKIWIIYYCMGSLYGATGKMIALHDPNPSSSLIPDGAQQKPRRRSSASMLRNIPNAEVAYVASGASPHTARTHSAATSRLSGSGGTKPANALPEYQHSLHSFLRRQLSNKPRNGKDRTPSAASSPGPIIPRDADKDVTEIDLDSGTGIGVFVDGRNHQEIEVLRPTVYPALFLNTALPCSASPELGDLPLSICCSCGTSGGTSSAPEHVRPESDADVDYFGRLPRMASDESRFRRMMSPLRSRAGTADDASEPPVEAYAKLLHSSRVAKLKKWLHIDADLMSQSGDIILLSREQAILGGEHYLGRLARRAQEFTTCPI